MPTKKKTPEAPEPETIQDTNPGAEAQAALDLSGATSRFGLNGSIEICDIEFEVRSPSNSELALYNDAVERHGYKQLSMELASNQTIIQSSSAEMRGYQLEYQLLLEDRKQLEQKEKKLKQDHTKIQSISIKLADLEEAMERARAKTKREQFMWRQIDAASQEIAALEAKSLAGKVTKAEEKRLDELYDQHEDLQLQVQQVRVREQIRTLKEVEHLHLAADAAHGEVIWSIAVADHDYDGTIEEWMAETIDQRQEMEDLITAMGFGHPLSVTTRALTGRSGTAGTSRRLRRASRKKSG